MESRILSAEALIKWRKCFSAQNQYMHDCHIKGTKNFIHHVNEEEDGSSEDETSEGDSKQEEEIKQKKEIKDEEEEEKNVTPLNNQLRKSTRGNVKG